MFRRLFFDHWVAIFPLASFVTAFAVYVTITYKAVRMRRGQLDRFARLPFNDQPSLRHDDADQS